MSEIERPGEGRRPRAARAAAALAVAALALGSGACRDGPFTEPQELGGEVVEAEVLNRGHELYQRNCASCHGEHGDGAGPAAAGMRPPPRDFRAAAFKFAGVPDRDLPHDEELSRIIREGLDGTPMRAWDLAEAEIAALVDYIKTFSPPGDGFRDPDRDVARPEIPPDPYEGREDEAIAEGEEIYHLQLQCNQCHPSYVGPERYEDWGAPMPRADAPYRPAPRYSPTYDDVLLPDDFLRHRPRSVRNDPDGRPRAGDLYRVMAYGLQGPMPGFEHLGEETLWALSHYVRWLIEKRGQPAGEERLRSLMRWEAALEAGEADVDAVEAAPPAESPQ